MTYTTTQTKKSQFTTDDTISNSSTFDFVKAGINKKTSWSNIKARLAEVFGLSVRLYETESAMVADTDLELGDHAIVEENRYMLYEVTNVSAGTNDVTLSNGLIAGQQGNMVNNKVADYTELRALRSTVYTDGDIINVTNDGIAGQFIVKTGTVTDNGITLIVFTDDSNRYIKRDYSGSLNIRWSGATGDGVTDDTAAINNTIAACSNLQNVFAPTGNYLISSTISSSRNIICDPLAEFIPDAAGSYTNNISGKKKCFDMTREGGIIRGARFNFTGKSNFVAVELSLQSAIMEYCTVNCDVDTDGNYGCSSTSNAQIVQYNIFNRCDIGYRMEFEGFANQVHRNRYELCGDCIAVDTSGITATNYPISYNIFNFPKRTGVLIDCSSADFRNISVTNNYYESVDNNTIFVSFTNPAFIQGTIAHNLVLGNASNTGQKGVYPASLPASAELLIMGNSFARLDTALNVNNSTLIANEYFSVTTRNASSANTGTIEERIKVEDKTGLDNIVIRPGAVVGSVAGTLTFSNTGNLTLTSSGGDVILSGLPTSSAGLPAGALWNNSGVVNIV